MAQSIDVLEWAALTEAINRIKSPADYLKQTLFGNHDPKESENIELSVLYGGRDCAPFVKVNGSAALVGGTSEKFQIIKAPNIRIKRPMQASEVLYARRAGTPIHVQGGTVQSAIEAKVARDTARLADMITNSEELLCSQILQGKITYSDETGDVFQLTLPRSSSHSVDLGALAYWTVSGVDPEPHVHDAKELISEDGGVAPTLAICGKLAAAAFRANPKVREALDTRNLQAGQLRLDQQFGRNGVIFLGNVYGLDWVEYPRKVNVGATATDLVRSKFVEFVSPGQGFIIYYGSIADLKALEGGQFIGERFSKSWEEEDPSVRYQLATSRPLPWNNNPDGTYSLQVVA